MIEGIPHTQGQSRAKIICDDCGRDECVQCAYVGPKHNTKPKESQARAKAIALGWSYVKNKLRCASCEAKRKVVPMQEPKVEAPREPSKRQRIEIFTMLAECYDIDQGRYMNGDTDDALAKVLGVMPGWVSQIREAEFGPDGGNDDMEKLGASFEEARSAFRDLLKELETVTRQIRHIEAQMNAQKNRLDSSTANLAAIRKAVGPRVERIAGVKA